MSLRQRARAPTGVPMFAEGVEEQADRSPNFLCKSTGCAHQLMSCLVVVYESRSVRACFALIVVINVLFRHYSAVYVQVPVLTFITDWYRGTFSRSLNVNQTATGLVSFIARGRKFRVGTRGVCGCVHLPRISPR